MMGRVTKILEPNCVIQGDQLGKQRSIFEMIVIAKEEILKLDQIDLSASDSFNNLVIGENMPLLLVVNLNYQVLFSSAISFSLLELVMFVSD